MFPRVGDQDETETNSFFIFFSLFLSLSLFRGRGFANGTREYLVRTNDERYRAGQRAADTVGSARRTVIIITLWKAPTMNNRTVTAAVIRNSIQLSERDAVQWRGKRRERSSRVPIKDVERGLSFFLSRSLAHNLQRERVVLSDESRLIVQRQIFPRIERLK